RSPPSCWPRRCATPCPASGSRSRSRPTAPGPPSSLGFWDEPGAAMSRLDPPPGGMTPFDHVPEVWAAFNTYYGTLWSDGVVDQATKEVGRLRNARVTGCGICKNLRFDGAVEAGLTEDLV